MEQVKFLKAVFHKFYLVHSWIPWLINGRSYLLMLSRDVKRGHWPEMNLHIRTTGAFIKSFIALQESLKKYVDFLTILSCAFFDNKLDVTIWFITNITATINANEKIVDFFHTCNATEEFRSAFLIVMSRSSRSEVLLKISQVSQESKYVGVSF